MSRRSQENQAPASMSTGEILALVLGGVVIAGGIGYLYYQNKQNQALQAQVNAQTAQAGQSLTQALQANPFGASTPAPAPASSDDQTIVSGPGAAAVGF